MHAIRGAIATLMFLDEAAFIMGEVMKVNIAPLLGNKRMALLAFSTPHGPWNWMTRLFTATRKTGGPAFNTLRIRLSCDKHEAMRVKCTCKDRPEIPGWRDTVRSGADGRGSPRITAARHRPWRSCRPRFTGKM